MMPASQKKAQVTVFAIIAILIVASVSLFFYLRVKPSAVPAEFRPVENYFLGCIENKVKEGADLLGAQAGYIKLPRFEAGSEYMPFSSQIDFLGTAVPYWFYISGNNIMKQQVPSLQDMENQLSSFLDEEIKDCDFSEFGRKGYNITVNNAKTTAKINDEDIEVSINAPLTINYGESSARITNHQAKATSKLGKFYKIAKNIYSKEQSELFLENYSLDVLHLYAPVTNVELSCSPKVWVKEQVKSDLKNALSENIAALKFKGDYYKTNRKYFITEIKERVNENVNLMYSPSWQTKIEIWPDEGEIMTAKPVGNQQGLGILGFCYVPYHFVYDFAFPVLVQVYDENELFQFPIVVSLEKNKARNAVLEGEALPEIETDICNNKVVDASIMTLDSNLKAVEADIKFKCLNEQCDVGKTKIANDEAVLETKVPPCIGGELIASADGYADSKLQIDTNEKTDAAIVMDKMYNLDVELFVGGAPISKDETALISFDSGDGITTISYPQQKRISLKEGHYNIAVQAYRQGNLVIGSQKTTQCVKVPATGIGGFFGMENEQCYDIEIPSQTLTNLLEGGGSTSEEITEDMLMNSKKLTISASIFQLPKTILDLQNAYDQVGNSIVGIGLS